MNKKQLEGLLASGDAAEKAAAAGALYNAYSAHLTVGAPASGQREAVKKATNDAMIKGPRRCCDTACVRVSTECPDTFAVDKAAIHAVAKGKVSGKRRPLLCVRSGDRGCAAMLTLTVVCIFHTDD